MKRKGFTLIELLVVISIISILISILLPALGKARKAAMTTKCMSGMRQSMTAVIMYSNDFNDFGMPNDGWQPFSGNSSDPPAAAARSWANLLQVCQYLPNTIIRSASASRGGQDCVFYTEVSPSTVTTCPDFTWVGTTDGLDYEPGQVAGKWSYGIRIEERYTSKGENWMSGDTPSNSCTFPRFSTLLTDRIYMADTLKSAYVLGSSTIKLQSSTFCSAAVKSYSGVVHRRHSNSANAAFPDGHVKTMSEQALKDTVPDSASEVYSTDQ